MKRDVEKFFEELAAAYVNKEGEELQQDVLRASNLSTEHLDLKLRQGLKGSAKRRERKSPARRNRNVILSTLAAVFAMFLIYNAVIPTMIRNDADWAAEPAAMEAPEEEFFHVEPEAEVAADEDIAMDVAEPEDVPSHMDEEAVEHDDVDELPSEPMEPSYFEGLFATTNDILELEASLPEGYFVMEEHFLEDSTRLNVLSATNQTIVLTERPGELTREDIQQEAEILEVNGVQVLQSTPAEGEYQLQFQVMNSIFTIEGWDIGELIAVAGAVIDVPELPGGYGMEYEIIFEIESIRLPAGLITIVPLQ